MNDSFYQVSYKRNSFWFAFFAITMVFVLFQGYFGNQAYSYTKDPSSQLQIMSDLNERIKDLPITDIQIKAKGKKCKKGFEKVPLYQWYGTVQGCQTGGEIYKGECRDGGSKLINSVDPQTFYTFKDTTFCVQRNSYFERKSSLDVCSEGNYQCNDNLCVKLEEKCPISEIFITDDPSILTDQLVANEQEGYSKLNLAQENYLYYKRNTPGLALTQLKVSHSTPCLQSNLYPNQQAYPLSNVKFGCGTNGADNNSVDELTQTSESQFFEENLSEETKSELPGFTDLMDDLNLKYGLYAVKQIKMNPSTKTSSNQYEKNDLVQSSQSWNEQTQSYVKVLKSYGYQAQLFAVVLLSLLAIFVVQMGKFDKMVLLTLFVVGFTSQVYLFICYLEIAQGRKYFLVNLSANNNAENEGLGIQNSDWQKVQGNFESDMYLDELKDFVKVGLWMNQLIIASYFVFGVYFVIEKRRRQEKYHKFENVDSDDYKSDVKSQMSDDYIDWKRSLNNLRMSNNDLDRLDKQV